MDQLTAFLPVASTIVFLLAVVWGGVSDLLTYRIPDWVSVVGVVAFFPAAFAAGWDITAVVWSFGAGVAVLVAGFALFALQVFGGGDAKLISVAAVWFGWAGLANYLVVVALGGGMLAIALVVLRRVNLPNRWAASGWVSRLRGPERDVPYGVAIAGAALVLYRDLPVLSAGLPAGTS